MNDDFQHLKVLSILHYVYGGLNGVVGCFPMIHLAVGLAFLFGKMPANMPQDQHFIFGIMFTVIPLLIILAFWAFAFALLVAGRMLAKRKWYTYCFVIACMECLFVPLGTVLGVFTILVLSRSSVKQLFEVENAGGLPPMG